MKITIIGTGYVGLVSGICFAEMGNDVTCVDINEEKIAQLTAGKAPIYEPGLEVLLERNLHERRVRFTTSVPEGIQQSSMIFLALPTPAGKGGEADLQYVLQVAAQLSELITSYTVIVNKSTVPVGTAERVTDVLAKKLDRKLYDVVSNPEFLREGVAVDDFLKPDRVIIGTTSDRAKKLLEELYQPFVRQGNPVYFMDERSAEMTKYAANAYLAMRISFMNEMANLCERVAANVDMVRIGVGSDSRIGRRFLFPGVGYGGSCFPKDVHALTQIAEQNEYDYLIVRAVMEVNQRQKRVLSYKIRNYFGNDLQGVTIAVWGLSFKPETDDIREAPALEIIQELLAAGAAIRAYDPEAMEPVRRQLGDAIQYAANQYEALIGVDALAIVTEWGAFRNPDFERMNALMAHPAIFDGRNVYMMEKMESLPFYYESIGRGIVHPEIVPPAKPLAERLVRERGNID